MQIFSGGGADYLKKRRTKALEANTFPTHYQARIQSKSKTLTKGIHETSSPVPPRRVNPEEVSPSRQHVSESERIRLQEGQQPEKLIWKLHLRIGKGKVVSTNKCMSMGPTLFRPGRNSPRSGRFPDPKVFESQRTGGREITRRTGFSCRFP
ncbi:hypothetical protein TNCV_4293561 [Trichonephila clavipes]|uniref:Uncharacterized protein n=1 Tax=Trichonephila clavipes TaxID=2585209 RepID=A0A8X6RMP2_TRICX|nr:hypothetical protein TNCV_4293561 [Trichonephila clavipes]